MFLNDTAEYPTLDEVAEEWSRKTATWGGVGSDIHVSLDQDEPKISFGDHEVDATKAGIEALAAQFQVPFKFLERVMPDEKPFILERRIERSEEMNLIVNYTTKDGIVEILPSGMKRLYPEDFIEVALDVLPGESTVVRHWSNPADLLLDVVVPEGFDQGIGGDRKVGDISHGGIRIGQDRKRNLAPWTQTLIYRLACTNGMEIPDTTLKVDARGLETPEIVMALRAEARRAFEKVTETMQAFYDLREQRLGSDRTGILRKAAQENALPERSVGALEDALTAYLVDEGVENPDDATMFHLVNLITNMANSPDLSPAEARRLQRVGGAMVNDHAARCSFCETRLN